MKERIQGAIDECRQEFMFSVDNWKATFGGFVLGNIASLALKARMRPNTSSWKTQIPFAVLTLAGIYYDDQTVKHKCQVSFPP